MTRRWPLFLLGLFLFVLAPISMYVQLLLHYRNMPYQALALATPGVILMVVSFWQRGGIVRGIGAVVFAVLCGLFWFMLLVTMRTPAYTGPQVGQKMPAFATTLASGATFSDDDLAKGQRTLLIFFRGHW